MSGTVKRPDFDTIAKYVSAVRDLYKACGATGPDMTQMTDAELRAAWEAGRFDQTVFELPDIDMEIEPAQENELRQHVRRTIASLAQGGPEIAGSHRFGFKTR